MIVRRVASVSLRLGFRFFFFFNDTATTEIYTLSLHDALPISRQRVPECLSPTSGRCPRLSPARPPRLDRKSTRLNSSHSQISYAVFCLKKKKIKTHVIPTIPYCDRPRDPSLHTHVRTRNHETA